MSKHYFFIEMTDTYAGEANYSWCNRFKVKASSLTGAIRKVTARTGFVNRIYKDSDYGDMVRWNAKRVPVCFFGRGWDEHDEHYMNIEEL